MKRILGFFFVAALLTVAFVGAVQAGEPATIDFCSSYCGMYGCNALLYCYCDDWRVTKCPQWCEGFCDE